LAFNREVVETPVPLTVTVAGELAALLMKETVPEAVPVAVGENDKLIVDCLPAPIVIGSDKPVILNPGAAILSCVTIRFDPPVFDTVIDWETVLPTATDPKLIDGGDTEMAAGVPGVFCCGWPDGFVAPERPTQPEIDNVPRTRRQMAKRPVRPAPAINFPAGSKQSPHSEIWEYSDSRRNP
jgi:hypothetical protein